MALIQCPHCGKSVSDTAEKCIHCGQNLKQPVEEKTENKMRDYATLGFPERKALKDEFYKINPSYPDFEFYGASSRKKQKACYWLGFLCYVIAVIVAVFFGMEEAWQAVMVIIAFVAGLIFDAFWYYFALTFGKYKKQALRVAKKYQKWLREAKNVDYAVTFSAREKKWKKYFDGINADVEVV